MMAMIAFACLSTSPAQGDRQEIGVSHTQGFLRGAAISDSAQTHPTKISPPV